MKVKVIGKRHMQGTSKKSGAPYNFYEIHYTANLSGIEGEFAGSISIQPSQSPYCDAVVGSMYNLEFDRNGYLMDFSPITRGTGKDEAGGKF